MKLSMHKQKGISLIGLIFVSTVLILVAVLGMKVTPDVLEYYTTLANVKATATDPSLRSAGVPAIRSAYLKRLQVSGGGSVLPEDLEITKEGNDIVISFAYSKKIHLFRNVNLMIDFTGSSSDSAAPVS